MKRLWLGIGVMLCLLLAGISITAGIHRICEPIWQNLEQAADAPSLDSARSLCDTARKRWENFRHFTASVTDHEPMEEIDALFEELEIYAQWGDRMRYAQCCARLASQTRAIAEAQAISWWNIF